MSSLQNKMKLNLKTNNMRNFSITKNYGEMYVAKVTDSYGNKYENYFETSENATEWCYFIWERESDIVNIDNEELLFRAIQECKEIDRVNNITKIM